MTQARLPAHLALLAAQRFCPMNAPACEVAAFTRLESHALRARVVMLWRIASGQCHWTERSAQLLHEGTLDSTSEAFDPYHAPFSRVMLDARADLWDAGLAPTAVREAVRRDRTGAASVHTPASSTRVVLVAGEVACSGGHGLEPLKAALSRQGMSAAPLVHGGGAVAWLLGARSQARDDLSALLSALKTLAPTTVVADGPQTLWWLREGPALTGLPWPSGMDLMSFAQALGPDARPARTLDRPVFAHDSRAAYALAGVQPDARCVMPGWDSRSDAHEEACGEAPAYDDWRRLLDRAAPLRVWSVWTRALARSCGADDGLWAAQPSLAAGLARQRLAHARELGAAALVTDSPLAAWWLRRNAGDTGVDVHDLASLYAGPLGPAR